MTSAASPGISVYDMPSDLEFRVTRVVEAPRAVAFDAWTNPKHLTHWLLGPPGWAMPVCEVDLRVGGAWRFGWRKEDGAELNMSGKYLEVVPPERVVSTERWGPEWPETINTVTFTETAGRTAIVLTVKYPSKAARDAALATGMKDGMDMSFARLDDVVARLVAAR